MATIEEQIINDMVATDKRGLPLLSEEEMANRGLIYDESSGVYKETDPNMVSATIPGEDTKLFTPSETQYIRMTDTEQDAAMQGTWTPPPFVPSTFFPTDIYRGGPRERDIRFHSPSGWEDDEFYPDAFFKRRGSVISERGGAYPDAEYQLSADLLNAPPNLTDITHSLARTPSYRPPYEGDYSQLAYREGPRSGSRAGERDLVHYQNLARYLDEMVDMPLQSSYYEYWTHPSTGDLMRDETVSGLDKARTSKADAINKAMNIHINKIGDLRDYDYSDVWLSPEEGFYQSRGDRGGYEYSDDVDVTDIVKGLADDRYDSDLRRYQSEMNLRDVGKEPGRHSKPVPRTRSKAGY